MRRINGRKNSFVVINSPETSSRKIRKKMPILIESQESQSQKRKSKASTLTIASDESQPTKKSTRRTISILSQDSPIRKGNQSLNRSMTFHPNPSSIVIESSQETQAAKQDLNRSMGFNHNLSSLVIESQKSQKSKINDTNAYTIISDESQRTNNPARRSISILTQDSQTQNVKQDPSQPMVFSRNSSPIGKHNHLSRLSEDLRKIQARRVTKMKVKVDPSTVKFICGINRFTDVNYDYMIRVNGGEMDLSQLSAPIKLHISFLEVYPAPNFKHLVLVGEADYTDEQSQSQVLQSSARRSLFP